MIRALVHRVLAVTLWPKVIFGIGLWMGVPLGVMGKSAFVAVSAWGFWYVRKGMREQYWEPQAEGYARRWENLVWDNSRWLNPETPDQGVDRLAGPWRDRCQSSMTSSTFTDRPASTRTSVPSAPAYSHAQQGDSWTMPDSSQYSSAPHLLSLPSSRMTWSRRRKA